MNIHRRRKESFAGLVIELGSFLAFPCFSFGSMAAIRSTESTRISTYTADLLCQHLYRNSTSM